MALLRPFAPGPGVDPFQVTASVRGDGRELNVSFQLEGPLDQLVLPDPAPLPRRRDGLWQGSCFEAFVGVENDCGYWEMNVSCRGDWNLYRFDGYRNGGRAEQRLQVLPVAWQRTDQRLELALKLPLPSWLTTVDPRLEIALTTVLEHREMGCQYWALRHCGAEPDFHQRASFVGLQHLH